MEKLITYETPNVAVYEIHSQRALCGSFGEAGMAGCYGLYVNETDEDQDY